MRKSSGFTSRHHGGIAEEVLRRHGGRRPGKNIAKVYLFHELLKALDMPKDQLKAATSAEGHLLRILTAQEDVCTNRTPIMKPTAQRILKAASEDFGEFRLKNMTTTLITLHRIRITQLHLSKFERLLHEESQRIGTNHSTARVEFLPGKNKREKQEFFKVLRVMQLERLRKITGDNNFKICFDEMNRTMKVIGIKAAEERRARKLKYV